MAKFVRSLKGDFDEFLTWIHGEISKGSSSVRYKDGSDIDLGDARVAVRVYERYSITGGNRVSLNVTVTGKGDSLFISAITSGGSKVVFFNVDTIGEETFLELCQESVKSYVAAIGKKDSDEYKYYN